jgi:uncharacterized protein (TIGR02001 family)
MFRRFLTAASIATLAGAGAAAAQDFSVSAGVALTSDYIVDGLTNSDRDPAVQPYIEIESGGFYAGIWGSNVRFPESDDRFEIDLYLGFRNGIGAFSYDLGYARYLYDDSGDDSGEFLLSLAVETPIGMTLGTDIGYNHTYSRWNGSLIAEAAISDMVSVSAEAGRVEGSHNYWNLGVGVGLNEVASLDLRVHDTDITSPRAVAMLSFDFSIR